MQDTISSLRFARDRLAWMRSEMEGLETKLDRDRLKGVGGGRKLQTTNKGSDGAYSIFLVSDHACLRDDATYFTEAVLESTGKVVLNQKWHSNPSCC
jgi:hypothetical protein